MPVNTPKKTAPITEVPAPGPGRNAMAGFPKWAPWVVVIFTALLYTHGLSNGFTNFDDDFYIINNPLLRDFSWQGITTIFTSFYSANYHPLTTVTNWLEFHFWGLEPFPYHLFNVLLHLANTWLVYKVVQQLSGKDFTALFTALLFGIHPMHVESVAWVAERKDVLYAFFFLLSLHYYLRYIAEGFKRRLYLATLACFVLSLLSKSAAVTLPVLLIAVDVYKGRQLKASAWLEKVPLFALSLTFGIVALLSQSSGGALRNFAETHSVVERLFFLTYGLSSYLVRLVAPLHLAALHNYPVTAGGALPWAYYASLPFLGVLVWLASRRSAYRKDILFGSAFFLIAISVMLQIVAVGSALTAERYTYIAYIGLFYIAGQHLAGIYSGKAGKTLLAVVLVVSLAYTGMAWGRIGVWKDAYTLFTDAIEQNPEHYFAYWMRGNQYYADGRKDMAIQDYNMAIQANAVFEDLYYDRGHAFFETNNPAAAIADYNKAIELKPTMAAAYNDRGWAIFKTGNKDAGLSDINKAIAINPDLAEAYNNRGSVYYETGDVNAALPDFDKAIRLKPDYELPYLNRAAIKANTKDFAGALQDYNTVLSMYPTDNGTLYNRGLVKLNLNDRQGACTDFSRAADAGNAMAAEAISRFCQGR